MTAVLEPNLQPAFDSAPRPSHGARLWSAAWRWIAAIGGALVIFGAIVLIRGANPFDVFADMFVSTFLRPKSLAEILVNLAPIALAALAVVVPARAGMSNVGGQGQMIAGAVGACGVGLALDQSVEGWVVIILMIVAGVLAGAAWAGIAALLRLVFKVNEAVSTLLLNFVALDMLLFLIYQPWRENPAGQPTTRQLAADAQLPVVVPDTKIDIGVLIAIAAAVGVWALLRFTRWGFMLAVVGGNAEAARRAALPVSALVLSALLVGGALAGLGGVVQFAGIEDKLRPGFADQLGYLGFLASWLARHKPFPVLLASFVLAALAVAGDSLQLDAQLPAATINILTALILLAVLGFTQKRKGLR